MAHDVFVSYAAQDKPTADAACATLEARQVRCWIAPRDVLPGDTATFPIPAGVYDLLVKNCDNETLADEFDLDISGATAYQVRE